MPRNLCPSVLILSSKYDLSCDYVVSRLRTHGVTYLRINTEDLPNSRITLEPGAPTLYGALGDIEFSIRESHLRSIYFRRPVFLRETGAVRRTRQEQLARYQWATFTRSVMVFERCRWVNHPAATYRAENKAVQLATAAKVGFRLPETVVSNDRDRILKCFEGSEKIALKGLDAVLVREGETETFGYTNILDRVEIESAEISSCPVVAQEALLDKIDLRVTVVGHEIFCAAVTVDGHPICGDWRLKKQEVRWERYDLPDSVASLCASLVKTLGLDCGAIDLAVHNKEFFFLEINPTGEWAWLVDEAGLPIDDAIARYLANAAS